MRVTERISIATPVILSLLAILGAGTADASPQRSDQQVQTALQLDANSKRGGELYRAQCSSCHGPTAYGNAEQLVPALAGQRHAYLIKQLADFVELDREATQMHTVAARTHVNDPQSWADVAAYLNGLPPLKAPQTGNGEMVSLGEASYRQWCQSCHDKDARGDDDGFVPALRNQHYAYLLKEMRAISAGHRFNVEADLQRFLDSLEADEMAGIADYLSRLSAPVRDRARLRDDGSVVD